MAKRTKSQESRVREPWAIAELTVGGFKSIRDQQHVEIRPLTILAGANSSGKSSLLQPLLLLKQTLEASYDPGPLLLNGPNVKFTSADQLLSRLPDGHALDTFEVGLRVSNGEHFATRFRKEHKMGFRIEDMRTTTANGEARCWPAMTEAEILKTGITNGLDFSQNVPEGYGDGHWEITRNRCFLAPGWNAQRSQRYECYDQQRDVGSMGECDTSCHSPAGSTWQSESARIR